MKTLFKIAAALSAFSVASPVELKVYDSIPLELGSALSPNEKMIATVAIANRATDGYGKVSGHSSAYYSTDPERQQLKISRLDMIPSFASNNIKFGIVGNIDNDIGDGVRIDFFATPLTNDTDTATIHKRFDLCTCPGLVVTQAGDSSCPPKMGQVEAHYSINVPVGSVRGGNYRVCVQATDAEEDVVAGYCGEVLVDGNSDQPKRLL